MCPCVRVSVCVCVCAYVCVRLCRGVCATLGECPAAHHPSSSSVADALSTIVKGVAKNRKEPGREYKSTKRRLSADNAASVQQPRPKISEKLLDVTAAPRAIEHSLTACKQRCLSSFSADTIAAARKANVDRGTNQAVHTWLVGYCESHTEGDHLRYEHGNRKLCRNCFLGLHGVSDHALRKAWRVVRAGNDGGHLHLHGNTGTRESPTSAWCYGWLEHFLNSECDVHPSGRRYLPLYLHLEDIQQSCAQAWYAEGHKGSPPQVDLLRKIWKARFPDVVQPLEGDWGTCIDCIQLKYKRDKGCKNELELAVLTRQQKEHRKLHRFSREQWEARRRESAANPEAFAHLTFDLTRGTLVPNFRPAVSVSGDSVCVS